jgi:hypothetical protein
MSRNDIRAIAARDCVSRPLSRRLNDIGAVSPWGYVSGPLSRNDIRAIAARDCVSGRPARLCYVALRLSRAYAWLLLELFSSQRASGYAMLQKLGEHIRVRASQAVGLYHLHDWLSRLWP